MAKLSNDKEIRCSNKCYRNNDFCKIHNISKDYYYKALDENSIETLMSIYDSFEEVPKQYWYKINNKWWDIRILIEVLAGQLNATDMETPKPIYPHDPFNRKSYSISDLKNLKAQIKKLKLNINIALLNFLKGCTTINKFLKEKRYNLSQGCNFNLTCKIVDLFKRKLRFMLINKKNSQEQYMGIWINKNHKFSDFENIYYHYLSEPDEYFEYDVSEDSLYALENPEKEYYRTLLMTYPVENIKIDDHIVMSKF
jgi:hypothetical protein